MDNSSRKLFIKRQAGLSAEKSFWEFFIALDLLEHPGKTYSPCNLDMAKQFTDELNAIFLQGHNLDNIEHYEFNCSKFTKEDVQESLELVKTFRAEGTLNPIQTIWCKLEDKIINLCLLNKAERDTTKVGVAKMLEDLLITVCVDSVIGTLQDSFYLTLGDCQKQMDSLEKAFTKIGEHFEENTYSNYLFTVGKKSQVVFSNILAYDIEKINDIISHDVLCIGTGFYNNQSIFDLITKILMSTSDIKLMTVVKDCISIIEASEFLGTLAYTIQNLGIKSKCNIIICFNVDNTKITYVLNSYFWRKSKHIINQILTKMYMLKSGKSICSLPC